MGELVARLERENVVLRRVAVAAARARRIGLALDDLESGAEKLYRENPDMTRSATGLVMAASAYNTAMDQFDKALLEAADVFVKDPFAEEISLVPSEVHIPRPTREGGEP